MLNSDISEKELLAMVVELAQRCGWLAAHFRPAMTQHGWRTAVQGNAGFPDLVLVRGKRLIFAELKSEKGKLTEEQSAWINDLRGCHILPLGWEEEPPLPEVYIWRPSQFDEIVSILQLKGE